MRRQHVLPVHARHIGFGGISGTAEPQTTGDRLVVHAMLAFEMYANLSPMTDFRPKIPAGAAGKRAPHTTHGRLHSRTLISPQNTD